MANNSMTDVDMDALADALFTDPNFGVNGGNVVDDNSKVSQKYNELTGKEAPRVEQSNGNWDDWFNDDEDDTDEFYDKPVSFDDIKDLNDDASDLMGDDEDTGEVDEDYDYIEPAEFFDRVPDDEVVFNGMTAGQLKELARDNVDTSEKHNFVKHHFEQLSNINGLSKSIISKNMLETQKRIQGIERALNHPGTLSSNKGALYDSLQVEKAKLREIENDYAVEEQAAAQRKAAATEYGFFTVDQIQKQKLGSTWNGNQLWNYVLRDRKIPLQTLEAIMSLPEGDKFADLAISALENDIRNKRTDKVAKSIMTKKATPKSVSTNKGKVVAEENSRAAYLARKSKKVGLTQAEHRESYLYLKD